MSWSKNNIIYFTVAALCLLHVTEKNCSAYRCMKHSIYALNDDAQDYRLAQEERASFKRKTNKFN